MSNSQFLNTASASIAKDTTTYLPVCGSMIARTVQAETERPIRDAGVFSNLFVYLASNSIDTGNSTINFRINTTNLITVTIAPLATGIFENLSDTGTATNTNYICYQVVTGTGSAGQNIIIKVLGIKFAPTTTTNTVQILAAGGTFNVSEASVTRYLTPVHYLPSAFSTTESGAKYRIREPAPATVTASDFFVYVSANSRTTTTTFRTRKNGNNGAQSVAFPSLESGGLEDTTNTDSLVAGDDFNYSVTTLTGTQALTVHTISCSLISTVDSFVLLKANVAGTGIAFNTTAYAGVAGSLPTFTLSEADTQIYPRFSFTARELGVYVSANGITTNATVVTLRDNGADSTLTVSYAAGETGLKLDSVNTTEITSGIDKIDFKVVTPNTSGNITFTWMGIIGVAIAEPVSASIRRQRILRRGGR